MKIYSDTKIFVFCPGNYYSGGPLSLHQLASRLRSLGFESVMCYINELNNPVHYDFRKYHLPFNFPHKINGEKFHNIIILPETMFEYLKFAKDFQAIIWWMSVDNFFRTSMEYTRRFVEQRAYIKAAHLVADLFAHDYTKIEHLYQSEYARQFLQVNDIPAEMICHELRGYLSQSFYDNESKIDLSLKENLIVFNPTKGFEFTEKLIRSAENLKFVPIYKLPPNEVQQLLARSKIYIDFGNHPGRERIPREAALSHCVVVTGRQGSAANDIDVPIPDDFKFDDTEENIPNIIAKLKYILENFKAEHDRQNSYRDSLLNEKQKFFDDVAEIFTSNIDTPPPRKLKTALVGDIDTINLLLREHIYNEELKIVCAVNDEFADQLLVVKFDGTHDKQIPVISTADADFLYSEKRIDKFIERKL